MWTEWLRIAAIVVGVFFVFVSSLGVFRLADFYQRIHAPTKAATLGLFCLLVAVTLSVPDRTVVTKAVLAVLFIGLTAPVGGHILARTAYRNGVRPSEATGIDEYAPAVERRRAERGDEPLRAHDLD